MVSYSHRLKSGHFTCYLNPTYHVLLTRLGSMSERAESALLECPVRERSTMTKKIDPLNKKQYGAVSAMLTVSDITAAVAFYQKAFGLYQTWHNERPRWQTDSR